MNLDEIGEFLKNQGFYLLKDDTFMKFMYLDGLDMKFTMNTLCHYCRTYGFSNDDLELMTRGDNLVDIAEKYLPKRDPCVLVENRGCQKCAQCSFLQEDIEEAIRLINYEKDMEKYKKKEEEKKENKVKIMFNNEIFFY